MNKAPPTQNLEPPRADREETTRQAHGHTWVDEYAWLRNPAYPEPLQDARIVSHLRKEDAYRQALMAPCEALTAKLADEIEGRLKQEAVSVPVYHNGFNYWWVYPAEQSYKAHYRAPADDPSAQPQLRLDENVAAKGWNFFELGSLITSPDNLLDAWSCDREGEDGHRVHIRPVGGSDLEDVLLRTSGELVWSADSKGLLYVELDEYARPSACRYHVLGTAQEEDHLIYQEGDPGFFLSLDVTQDRQFAVLSSADHTSGEVRMIPTGRPLAAPRLISKRRSGHEYLVEHAHGYFYIMTNDVNPNSRLVRTLPESPGEEHWEEVVAASDRIFLQGFTPFAEHFVLEGRIDGLPHIHVHSYEGECKPVEFPDPAYCAEVGAVPSFDTDTLRINYESMGRPFTIWDYNMTTGERNVVKVQEIPAGYAPEDYETHRLMAAARDGVRIPISIIHRKGLPRDGSAPVYLHGYGAYGAGLEATFATPRISLLDRGFVYAIAHIRGGDELGHHWYEGGKGTKRMNAFNDFVDAAVHLVERGYTTMGKIVAAGSSAGGQVVGAVANMHPEIWAGIIAQVPFVDCLNTMLDDSLALTPMEWPEWGNPIEDPAAFALIRSYSPYDNVKPQAYPPVLATCSVTDSRVPYWEAAKWVARLRDLKTDNNPVVLKAQFDAGHGGASGRWAAVHEIAEEYAFILRYCFGSDEAA